MSLNAAVDAPLNSGVGAFRQVFLSEDYLERFPERAEQVQKLREAIDEQVSGGTFTSDCAILTSRRTGQDDRQLLEAPWTALST